jgi:hypothetical protein
MLAVQSAMADESGCTVACTNAYNGAINTMNSDYEACIGDLEYDCMQGNGGSGHQFCVQEGEQGCEAALQGEEVEAGEQLAACYNDCN